MANFETALKRLLQNEGGYINDKDDQRGETYKGIARKMNGNWKGWIIIDKAKTQPGFPENLEKDAVLRKMISDFYEVNYWNKLNAQDIINAQVAFSIFDFAVNAGVDVSAKLAQIANNVTSDGIIGPVSIQAINNFI